MTLLESALAYYDRGWMPIPLRSDGSVEDRKKPAIDRWRQYQYVRPERTQIEEWWTQLPDANIALICGRVSGLVVVDFDAGENHGIDPVEFLLASDMPRSIGVVETGKGWHFYFRHPGGTVANGVRVGRLRGVPMDIRGDGGYVVAPPSVHGSGWVYAWLQDPGEEMALLPDAIKRALEASPDNERVETLTPTEYIRQATELDRLLAGADAGERNNAAARVIGYFVKVTKRDLAAAWAMTRVWNRQNRPPLPEPELQRTFQSIERADAENALDELVEAQDDEHLLVGSAWADAVRDAPPRVGIQAPSLPCLEEVGGLVPKDLLIVAGRPGMGKSTIAWGIAYDAALRQRLSTILFSTEMTAADVARWMASRIHGVPVSMLPRPAWLSTLDLISHSPVTVCDRGSVTVDYIKRVVEHRPETRLVIIDHIQRVQSKGFDGDNGNRNQALEQMTVALKNLAKDHNCTVIILSQMNRQGALTRPTLAALRDSGGLEQEADAVFFVWSDVDDLTVNPLPCKVLLAKNRHGALREVECLFKKDIHRFEPVDLTKRLIQHTMDAKATERLNAIMRGDDPDAPRVPERHPDQSSAPASAPEPGPAPGAADDPEDALLRLLA